MLRLIYSQLLINTRDMCFEKCVGWFCRCEHVTECAYTSIDGTASYTPSLYGIIHCSWTTNLYDMLLYKTTEIKSGTRVNEAIKTLGKQGMRWLLPAYNHTLVYRTLSNDDKNYGIVIYHHYQVLGGVQKCVLHAYTTGSTIRLFTPAPGQMHCSVRK